MELDEAEAREEIRRVRLDEDLPVDERVLDELIDAWGRGQMLFATKQEAERLGPEYMLFEQSERRVIDYARDHADSYAGYCREYENGSPTLVAAFVGPLEPHRVALALPRVRVVSARRTIAELEAITAILTADRHALVDHLTDWGPDPQHGVVRVHGVGTDEAKRAVEQRLLEQFGDAVELAWNLHGRPRY